MGMGNSKRGIREQKHYGLRSEKYDFCGFRPGWWGWRGRKWWGWHSVQPSPERENKKLLLLAVRDHALTGQLRHRVYTTVGEQDLRIPVWDSQFINSWETAPVGEQDLRIPVWDSQLIKSWETAPVGELDLRIPVWDSQLINTAEKRHQLGNWI